MPIDSFGDFDLNEGETAMQFVLDKRAEWSKWGLRIALGGVLANVALTIPHAIFEGFVYGIVYGNPADRASWMVLATLCSDLRILSDQFIFVGAILFVGAKFFETHTSFSVGFDKMDAARVIMKGPDDDNIVWIGHRYGSRMEAEAVACTIESRLKDGES